MYRTQTVIDRLPTGLGRGQSWSSVAKPWMIRRTTVHNSWWCQRFHDWLRSLTNSREYSYGVGTNKHDSATVALRIRPCPITTTIRHECFKQFKTSIALPWSFPNHHDSSRFTTVLLRITTVHDDFTNRGES